MSISTKAAENICIAFEFVGDHQQTYNYLTDAFDREPGLQGSTVLFAFGEQLFRVFAVGEEIENVIDNHPE